LLITIKVSKIKVYSVPIFLQNAKIITLSQGLDHLNLPKVDGCKLATKDTKPKWEKVLKNELNSYIFKFIYLQIPLENWS
jgi:hypothetical protein